MKRFLYPLRFLTFKFIKSIYKDFQIWKMERHHPGFQAVKTMIETFRKYEKDIDLLVFMYNDYMTTNHLLIAECALVEYSETKYQLMDELKEKTELYIHTRRSVGDKIQMEFYEQHQSDIYDTVMEARNFLLVSQWFDSGFYHNVTECLGSIVNDSHVTLQMNYIQDLFKGDHE